MIDFGFDKLALIGAVALVVIGPEKLPRVARTVGHLLGKAQRYVADVKAEVNRSIELEELKKMKTHVEEAAREVEQKVNSEIRDASDSFEQSWQDATSGLSNSYADGSSYATPLSEPPLARPKKNWRVKRSAVPQWFKQHQGVRRHVQSGAARVARFRPPRRSS